LLIIFTHQGHPPLAISFVPPRIFLGNLRLSSSGKSRNAQNLRRKAPSIIFTEEQAKGFENLQRAFFAEAKPLWSKLRDLRLEMRYVVSDSQTQPQVLLEKHRKMSAIQTKVKNRRFSYLIKARAIFTREQLERLPPDCPLKMGTQFGMGKDMGKRHQGGIPH
jgi:hypothetical protein